MKIGLDIDGVLANFVQGFIDRAVYRGLGESFPKHWTDWKEHKVGDKDHFDRIWAEVVDEDQFWLFLAPLVKPADIVVPVDLYVTARPRPSRVTELWLEAHKFPKAPVITVPYGSDKTPTLTDEGIDLYVDDNVMNYQHINAGGRTKCLLWDAPPNRGFNTADRVRSFAEVAKRAV